MIRLMAKVDYADALQYNGHNFLEMLQFADDLGYYCCWSNIDNEQAPFKLRKKKVEGKGPATMDFEKGDYLLNSETIGPFHLDTPTLNYFWAASDEEDTSGQVSGK